jgi:hypothetical protein
MSLGIPRDWLLVGGRGEQDQRVRTGIGVFEPQNNRVEITLVETSDNEIPIPGSPTPLLTCHE